MDILRNVKVDVEILREPRGFMRIVQLVLAIFAFGTITSVKTTSNIIVNCGVENVTHELVVPVQYGYPFRITKTAHVMLPFCSEVKVDTAVFKANYSSAAEFFCFIGVMSFLAYVLLLPAYVLLGSFFAKCTLGAKADFLASGVWTLLWFISSTAWADNLSKMTNYMDPENLIAVLGDSCKAPHTCRAGQAGDHSTLVVSVLFGFLNTGLTGANLWFLFKETEWHKGNEEESDPSAYADPGYQTTEYEQDPTMPDAASDVHSSFNNQQGMSANDYYSPAQSAY
ncbi:synaptophysin-like [Watersipora subatra]|uniref:synaptophysin-like n=1 Tax=Watersipora subatra TaxID=2589382 RepID=UPI00355C977E